MTSNAPLQWVAPPGWPQPPPGWSPPPGWTPDPSWPPPPPDWRWWVPARFAHTQSDTVGDQLSQSILVASGGEPSDMQIAPQGSSPENAPDPKAKKLGFFAERKLRKALDQYKRELDEWQETHDQLSQFEQEATSFYGSSEAVDGLILRAKEKAFLVAAGAVLIEPRTMPGQYVGGSRGTSFRVMKGVSFRVGSSRGTYQPGPTSPTPIDTGQAVITDQRVIFGGTKASREWAYTKLIGYSHADDGSWTAIQVSNRQKTSGIGYGTEHGDLFRFRLELAIATWRGSGRDTLIDDLRSQIGEHEASRPVEPQPL